jgi:methylated-DNA-protein-cysteine methyltransferase-like protein
MASATARGRKIGSGGAVFARVHALVAKIPQGRVATYGQLSELIEGRLSPAGIGWALRASDGSLPWHRVVNSKGGLSTDSETPGRQRALLEAEGVQFSAEGLVDLKKYRWRRAPPGHRDGL